MRRARRPPALALTGLLAFAACAALGTAERVALSLDPFDAERRVEDVFDRHGIPVTERSPDGVVESGPFRADLAWGPAIRDRVACQPRPGTRPGDQATSIQIEVRARIDQLGAGSVVELGSHGTAHFPEGPPARCRLSAAFTSDLMAAIGGSRGPR